MDEVVTAVLLTRKISLNARILRVGSHGSTPRDRYARLVHPPAFRRHDIHYLLMWRRDARRYSARPGSSSLRARCALPLPGGVRTMCAVGPDHSERSAEAHGGRKSIGRESGMVREKTLTA